MTNWTEKSTNNATWTEKSVSSATWNEITFGLLLNNTTGVNNNTIYWNNRGKINWQT